MLEYDNNAFYYFALTFIALYAIPGTYFVSSELYAAYLKPAISDTQARTTLERKKAQHLKSELYGYNRINYPAFWINLVLVCICWLAAFLLVTLVKQDGVVSSFDPYDILEIGREATVQEIKRAYRRLSLKYHPDKNPGDMEAADIFMKIAKAHQALTDPDAMANWKQFGNPDGKQSLEVSIGLPSILVENPKIVLVLYLCSMIIFIPIVVGLWYANSKQYGDKNILYETYSAFYQLLTPEHNHVRVMPELIAASGECRNIISEYMPLSEELGASKSNAPNPHKKEDMAISKLYGSKLSKIMYKPRLEHPSILRSNILMHAHLCRMTDDLPPLVLKILEKILLLVPELVDGIIEIAVQRKWLLSVLSAIYFQQHMVQAISWTISMENSKMPTIGVPLLQFPHLNAKHITSICALIGNKLKAEGGNANNTAGSATSDKQQVKAISKFLELSEEEKFRGLDLNAEQKSDILKACELIPNMFVDFAVFVEEEEGDEENFYLGNVDKSAAAASKNAVKKPKSTKGKKGNSLATLSCPDAIANSNKAIKIEGTDIFEGDLVTIRVVIRRGDDEKKLTKKSRDVIPSVHAPYYPGVLKENLWLIALAEKPKLPPGQRGPPGSEEPAIIACEKLQSQRRYLEKDIKFLAPPKAGEYKFQLRVYSDAYIGLDFMTEASYTVKPASEVPEYEFHEEDLAVDAEPSLFDQLMSTATDSDSDSDSDSDEEVNAVPASDAKVSLETEENMPTAVGNSGYGAGLVSTPDPQRNNINGIIFIKTHKTGSSTLSSILLKICSKYGYNLYVPPVEHAGKIFNVSFDEATSKPNKDWELINNTLKNGLFEQSYPYQVFVNHLVGTNTNNMPASNINGQELLIRMLGESAAASNALKRSENRLIVPPGDDRVSDPLVYSVVRRPGDRFRSAYNWYQHYLPAPSILRGGRNMPSNHSTIDGGIIQWVSRAFSILWKWKSGVVDIGRSSSSAHLGMCIRQYIQKLQTQISIKSQILGDHSFRDSFKYRTGFDSTSQELTGCFMIADVECRAQHDRLITQIANKDIFMMVTDRMCESLLIWRQLLIARGVDISIVDLMYLPMKQQPHHGLNSMGDTQGKDVWGNVELNDIELKFLDRLQPFDLKLYQISNDVLDHYVDLYPYTKTRNEETAGHAGSQHSRKTGPNTFQSDLGLLTFYNKQLNMKCQYYQDSFQMELEFALNTSKIQLEQFKPFLKNVRLHYFEKQWSILDHTPLLIPNINSLDNNSTVTNAIPHDILTHHICIYYMMDNYESNVYIHRLRAHKREGSTDRNMNHPLVIPEYLLMSWLYH